MIVDLERQQLLCSENYCEVLKSSRLIGTCKMSDYTCNNGANRGHINIPPPPLPPNMQPYGFNPGSAPPYRSMAEPNQFSNNPSMYPHPPSNQVNFFSPPPSPAFNAATSPLPPPPPTPHHLHPPPYFSAPPPFPVRPTFQPEILPSSSHQIPNAEENNVDKIWIRNWLERRRKPNKTLSGEEKDVSGSTKISDVKAKVLKIWKLIQELESQTKSLMIMMKTLNEEQWRTRVAEIEVEKLALVELLDEFENKRELLMDVKRKLLKRSRKRNREKKRRAERRIEQTERRIACEKENKRIDLWLKEKEEEVERTRREEEMKREADDVLSGVTRRKNEAKRQLALLEGLRKLHEARVVARNAMGLVTSTTQLETFSTVIDRLTAMWNGRLDNYHMEEHGLKVMLNESNAEDKASVANRHKLILRQWETALFGSATNLPQDKESFLANRKDWDSFVVSGEDSVMSSSIPVGWIIPCEPSSEEWRRLLHVHKQKSIMEIGE